MKTVNNSPRFARQNIETTKKKAFKNAQRRATEALGIHASSKSSHGPVPSIELFQREDCPFSHAVRNTLTRLGLDYIAHNVSEKNALKHEQLKLAGGKDQVPFMIDHLSGVKLYESSAIISYLDKSYGEPSIGLLGRLATGFDAQIRSRADQIAWTLRTPLMRVQGLGGELQDVMKTVRGSLNFVRDRVEAVMAKAKPVAPRASTPSKTAKVSGIRPNVASVTEAA